MVSLTIFAFVWGINFMKGRNLFSDDYQFHIIYDDIQGLGSSSSVLINGVKIGKVAEIRLMEDGSNRVLVTISVRNDLEYPVGTVAKIFSDDLLGTRKIQLHMPNKYELAHKNGDTLLSAIQPSLGEQVNEQVLPVKRKAEKLMSQLDTLITSIQMVFNPETRKRLQSSFVSINGTILNLENITRQIDTIMASGRISRILHNVEYITTNFKQNSDQINVIVDNFADISDSLAQIEFAYTINKVNSVLDDVHSLLAKVENGEGTLGQLMSDDKLYRDVEEATKNLDLLIRDIRLNPKRYLHFSAMDFGSTKYVVSDDEDVGYYKDREREKEEYEDIESTAKAKEIFFTVQILSSKQPLPSGSPSFKGYSEIEEYRDDDGVFKYYTGKDYTPMGARDRLEIIKMDFPDAFIIAFEEGERIPTDKAYKEVGYAR